MEVSYANGGKLLVARNGSSAADSEYIVGELMKGVEVPGMLKEEFRKRLDKVDEEMEKVLGDNLQGELPAIALDVYFALSTAYMSDCEPLLCFAQQVNGCDNEKAVFLGISTSGNSKNILYAATVENVRGLKVIGLTGVKYSKLSAMVYITIRLSLINLVLFMFDVRK